MVMLWFSHSSSLSAMMTPALPSSSDQTSRQRELHPVLSAALSSLDMDLDAELTRYQLAQRPGSSLVKAGVLSSATSPEAAAQDDGQAGSAAVAADFVDNPFSNVAPGYDDLSAALTRTQAPDAEQSNAAPETYLASSEELLRSLDNAEVSDAAPLPQQRRFPNLLTPLGVGLLLLISLSSLTAVTLLLNARSTQQAQSTASDQIAVADSDAPLSPLAPDLTLGEFTRLDLSRLSTLSPRSSRSNRRLLMPRLDTGALDTGTVGEGSSLGEPSSLDANSTETLPPQLTPAQPPSLQAVPPQAAPPQAAPPQAAPQPSPRPRSARAAATAPIAPAPVTVTPPAAPSPATSEATSQSDRNVSPSASGSEGGSTAGNSVRDDGAEGSRSQAGRSQLDSSQPRATQPDAAQPNSARSNTPQPSTSRSSTTQPAAPAAPADPEPTSQRPAPAPPEPEARASEYHHVVIPYTGDRSLRQAQEAVSGAYLSNSSSGAQVQLGVFQSESSAQQLVNQLAQQGITATIQSE